MSYRFSVHVGLSSCKNRADSVSWLKVIKCVPYQSVVFCVSYGRFLYLLIMFWVNAVFCFIVFGYQYQCNRLPGKTRLQNEILCVEWNVKPYTLTQSLVSVFHDGGYNIANLLPLFGKPTSVILEFYFQFWFWLLSSLASDFALAYQIFFELDHWRHINFPRWQPQRHESTSGFEFDEVTHLRTSTSSS